jgi:hypothetical protein
MNAEYKEKPPCNRIAGGNKAVQLKTSERQFMRQRSALQPHSLLLVKKRNRIVNQIINVDTGDASVR